MEREKKDDADMVESGGETTAAATGTAEIGAATGSDTTPEDESNAHPVGADTMVKVADDEEEN